MEVMAQIIIKADRTIKASQIITITTISKTTITLMIAIVNTIIMRETSFSYRMRKSKLERLY